MNIRIFVRLEKCSFNSCFKIISHTPPLHNFFIVILILTLYPLLRSIFKGNLRHPVIRWSLLELSTWKYLKSWDYQKITWLCHVMYCFQRKTKDFTFFWTFRRMDISSTDITFFCLLYISTYNCFGWFNSVLYFHK